jgi:phage major head subunit gpT-like protein
MINSSSIYLKGIKTEFAKQLAIQENSKMETMCFVNTDKVKYNDYLLLDSMPEIYEWVDSRSGGKVKTYELRVDNKPYQTKILENRRTLEYGVENLSGSVMNQLNGSVQRWAGHIDKLVVNALVANGTTFDGSAFFANSHNIDGSTAIDNLYTGTGTTLAQVTADYDGASSALKGFVDKNGEPFNEFTKLVVICPHTLENTFKTLKNSTMIETAGGAAKSNIYANDFEIISSTRLTGNDWYIANMGAFFPPFILQKSLAPKWVLKDDEEDIYVKFLADADFGLAYGNFTAIIKIDN